MDVCSKAEIPLATRDGVTRMFYRACWRSNLPCFHKLTTSKSTFSAYLELDLARKCVVFINIGLHDIIFQHNDLGTYFSGVQRLFTFASHWEHVVLTWIQPYPLIEPNPGKNAKFGTWRDINARTRAMATKTSLLAMAFDINTFDIEQYLGSFAANMSLDTVHLKPHIDDSLVLPLLASADVKKRTISFEKFHTDDTMCGNQAFPHLSNNSLTIAAFGGSVTADGSYLNPLVAHMELLFNRNVTVLNFAEPATGPQYASLCAVQSLAWHANMIDIVIVEFCQNDFDKNVADLTRLIKSLKQIFYVFYYCHFSPRLVARSSNSIADAHWTLMRKYNVSAFRNKGMMDIIAERDALRDSIFRDSVHLSTPYGGSVVSKLVASSLFYCSQKFDEEIVLNRHTRNVQFVPRNNCFTNLGPRQSRNFQHIVEHSNGWRFVENAHRSTTTGKNGYETNSVGSCIALRAPKNVCSGPIFLFYLTSGKELLGRVNVTANDCEHSQQISGFVNQAVTHTTRVQLTVLNRCCADSNNGVPKLITICSIGEEADYKFRIIAIAEGGPR